MARLNHDLLMWAIRFHPVANSVTACSWIVLVKLVNGIQRISSRFDQLLKRLRWLACRKLPGTIWHTELITEIRHMFPARHVVPIRIHFDTAASSVLVLAVAGLRVVRIRLAQRGTLIRAEAPEWRSIKRGCFLWGRRMSIIGGIHAIADDGATRWPLAQCTIWTFAKITS